MIAAEVDVKAAQQRPGHSRPNTLLIHYAHVLDSSADDAAGLLSGQMGNQIPAAVATSSVAV